MKTLQHLCAAAVLSLSLTISAFAGDMQTPGTPSSDTQQTTGAIAGPVLELTMGFWLSVPSMF